MTVVVATEDFEVYHDVVGELRDRGVIFTTVEPDGELPDGARIVIRAESDTVQTELPVIVADPERPRQAVEEALTALRGENGRTIIGIDPGTRPGIAVLSGEMVVASFQVPLADAADVVREEVADAIDPVVRIGDGARLQGAQLIRELEDVQVEMVDETGTTPYLGTGARGMGDVLAAVNIARLEGEIVEERDIEPTAGELGVIKRRSRERSADNREIDEELARRVAAGELTIEEALRNTARSNCKKSVETHRFSWTIPSARRMISRTAMPVSSATASASSNSALASKTDPESSLAIFTVTSYSDPSISSVTVSNSRWAIQRWLAPDSRTPSVPVSSAIFRATRSASSGLTMAFTR